MLVIVFMVLSAVVIYHARWGEFKKTLCNVAVASGLLAGIAGLVVTFVQVSSNNKAALIVYLLVMIYAALLRRTAKRFVKLYEDKQREEAEKLNAYRARHNRGSDEELPPCYTDETFDDPELRFGKGGYTDNKL